MQCAEFENRLNDVLDARESVAADPLLQDHAAGCDDCRQLMDSLSLGFTALGDFAPPDVSPRFAREVMTRVEANRNRRTRSLAAALAASAALLVVVGLSLRTEDVNPADGGMRAAAPAPEIAAAKESAIAKEPAAPVGVIARKATDRYLELASATRAHVSDAMRIVPGFERSEEPEVQETDTRDWFDGVSEGVRPFTGTTADALDTLLNALPMGAADGKDASL